MGKIYKTKLNIKSKKVLDALKMMSGVYRKMFNYGMDAQFYKMTVNFWPEQQLISATNLNKVVTLGKKTQYPYVLKVDSGITARAVNNAQFSFTRWYELRRTRLPEYLARKDGMYFGTTTKIKVFYDHITFPKLGKIKLYEKGYIPQGMTYKNVRFSYDGKNWWVALEACEKETTQHKLTENIIRVSTDMDGVVTLGDKTFSNIVEAPNYKAQKAKRAKLVKKLKRQKNENAYLTGAGKRVVRTSRNMMKTRNQIIKISAKMQEIKNDTFRKIASELARTKPKEVQLLSLNEARRKYQKYLSRYLRESGTKQLLNMIHRKALSIGSKVTRYSEALRVAS